MLQTKNYYVLLLLILVPLFVHPQLPTQLMDISLGQCYKEIKQKVQLKRIRGENNVTKTYKVILNEETSLKIVLELFQSKVYKITISYDENFVDETDWENIYNIAINTYGMPKKVNIEQKNNILYENYLWEDEDVKQLYQRVVVNNEFKNFVINLIDKKVEQKITELPPIKKLYYIFVNLF